MFGKKLMKIIAFVLTLVMTVYLLPLDAMAYELNSDLADPRFFEEETQSAVSREIAEPANVVAAKTCWLSVKN